MKVTIDLSPEEIKTAQLYLITLVEQQEAGIRGAATIGKILNKILSAAMGVPYEYR